jgi:hypothetical protein
MYTANELMFPHHAIPVLREMRGSEWKALVERIMQLPETHEETLAFMLMMIRLNGCLECETDSYRAMKGCDACAVQTLRRYKGPDVELVRLFQQALAEVREQDGHHPRPLVRPTVMTNFIPIEVA